jgi:Na+/H+ antiporter NhaD/arsenite permease-like protein
MLQIDIGPTFANITIGFLSAIVDNIPVMFAVLSMSPDMELVHWLLVTLTAGHAASIVVHRWINADTFSIPVG